jgi:putative endonuclease
VAALRMGAGSKRLSNAPTRRAALAKRSGRATCSAVVALVAAASSAIADRWHVVDPRNARGAAGEQAAADMLAGLGYEIVERNFRTRYGELDIVAADGETLVFCEVRSRVGRNGIAWALESIGPNKQTQLRKMAAEWFRLSTTERPRTGATRFDAVAVAIAPNGRVLAMEHVRNAF